MTYGRRTCQISMVCSGQKLSGEVKRYGIIGNGHAMLRWRFRKAPALLCDRSARRASPEMTSPFDTHLQQQPAGDVILSEAVSQALVQEHAGLPCALLGARCHETSVQTAHCVCHVKRATDVVPGCALFLCAEAKSLGKALEPAQ